MGLKFVTRAADDLQFYDQTPEIEVHYDCIYVPLSGGNFWQNDRWGVYNSAGDLLPAAAYCASPGMSLTGQNRHCLVDWIDAPYAPMETYFYVGNIIPHYGHFICSSMSRLWALPECGNASLPLLGHAEGGPRHWFRSNIVSSLFGVADIICEDFAHFDYPVRIKKLIVARPAFVEKNFSHRTFARVANRWGDRLVKTRPTQNIFDIIYISKSKLSKNPDGLSNEAEISRFFEEKGYMVAYPEQLSLSEQVAIFRTHRTIIGQVGSAFHTSIFSPPIADQRIICINPSLDVYSSNHALIDYANNNNAIYVHFAGETHERQGANPGFRIADPQRAAQELYELARSDFGKIEK